ncbi:hypothetical protein AMS68_002938 [Peltaster fructicola]|uniref:Uncharacterized protein n=1 Tax=Peltaster fructicola TaxID=286661 RepID=A0A6H0XRY8_9PEZI|nr:hypothetical protein AMS68_002938 [Peltaster fructicola]
MSTFDGRVKEFPDIRIDNFRVLPNETVPPLAFFLSHVHSDHLKGLEACKSLFIYCTPATKHMLLRLEKRSNRIHFAQGIREHREPTYAQLKRLLRPIPLETPTKIELAPGRSIRVTLFDANHCTGACVFLVEDEQHAILYTGDIRSEQWWVDSLVRQPLLLPYSCNNGGAPLKRLDCIYLDTTFATSLAPYKHFPSKRDGIHELLAAIAKYPADTMFYFNTWTFGYEEVWIALSGFLHSKIHVDDYRFRLYNAPVSGGPRTNDQGIQQDRWTSETDGPGQLIPQIHDRFPLIGYNLGNHFVQGCLTQEPARLHSCEYGTKCEIFEKEHVRILPIISRHDGVDIPENGAGGGHGDLDQLELDEIIMLQGLIEVCQERLQDRPVVLEHMESWLLSMLAGQDSPLLLDLATVHLRAENPTHPLDGEDDAWIPAIVRVVDEKRRAIETAKAGARKKSEDLRPDGLPRCITFPYSRHSSYEELRFVIKAFLPHEIYPCTVDEGWTESDSMERLFSDLYPPGKTFHHDGVVRRLIEQRKQIRRQRMQKSRELARVPAVFTHKVPSSSMPAVSKTDEHVVGSSNARQPVEPLRSRGLADDHGDLRHEVASSFVPVLPKVDGPMNESSDGQTPIKQCQGVQLAPSSSNPRPSSGASIVRKALQREAFNAASSADWTSIELISTSGREAEIEL